MGGEITVDVKVVPRGDLLKREVGKLSLKNGSTIDDLLRKLYESYTVGDKRYVEGVGWVNIFWGYLLIKNGVTIGSFDRNGFKPSKNVDLKLKDGDEVAILLPAGGG